jgi:hypothetical protein
MAAKDVSLGLGGKGLVSLDVVISAEQLQAVRRELGEVAAEAPKICRRGINRTGEDTLTVIAAAVAEELALGQHEIRRRNLSLLRARDDRLEAVVRIFGRRIPLMHFAARATRKGVTYRIRRAGGRSLAFHAFIATMASGHVAAFARRLIAGHRVARLPIGELYGPSVVAAVEGIRELARDAMEREIARRLEAHIDHELQYVLMRRRGVA